MSKCKSASTLLVMTGKLSVTVHDPLKDEEATQCISIVGGLQYLTLTRLNISFIANRVCQFLHSPTTLHMEAVKRVLRYMQGTLKIGLKFHPYSSLHPSAFSDVDWAACPDDRRSTGGFAIYLGANRQFLGQAQKRSIKPWRMPLWRPFGCNLSYESLA
jgi:hypothetical protein